MLSEDVLQYRILRRQEVLTLVGVSSATLARWIKDGNFPSPVKLGPNSVGWRESAIREWIGTRPLVDGNENPTKEDNPKGGPT